MINLFSKWILFINCKIRIYEVLLLKLYFKAIVVRIFFDTSNFGSCNYVYFYEMVHEWTEALKNELAEINQQAHFVFLYVA